VIRWWPAGESVPAPQPPPGVQSAPVAAQKNLPSLPAPPLKPEDWPQVEKAVRQAMAQRTPILLPAEMIMLSAPDQQPSAPLVGQMECLLGWLKTQECVKAVRAPTAEAEGLTALLLLTSLPAQVEIEVDFFVEDQEVQSRILTLAVDAGEQFQFVSLRPGSRTGP
jgi:hypothetical protein